MNCFCEHLRTWKVKRPSGFLGRCTLIIGSLAHRTHRFSACLLHLQNRKKKGSQKNCSSLLLKLRRIQFDHHSSSWKCRHALQINDIFAEPWMSGSDSFWQWLNWNELLEWIPISEVSTKLKGHEKFDLFSDVHSDVHSLFSEWQIETIRVQARIRVVRSHRSKWRMTLAEVRSVPGSSSAVQRQQPPNPLNASNLACWATFCTSCGSEWLSQAESSIKDLATVLCLPWNCDANLGISLAANLLAAGSPAFTDEVFDMQLCPEPNAVVSETVAYYAYLQACIHIEASLKLNAHWNNTQHAFYLCTLQFANKLSTCWHQRLAARSVLQCSGNKSVRWWYIALKSWAVNLIEVR